MIRALRTLVLNVVAGSLIAASGCSAPVDPGASAGAGAAGGRSPTSHPSTMTLRSGATITVLGTLGGDGSRISSINGSGQGVGSTQDAHKINRAFFWNGASLVAMDDKGSADSYGRGINAHGQAIFEGGTDRLDASGHRFKGQGATRSFFWSHGKTVELGPLPFANGKTVELGPLPFAINDDGVVLLRGLWNDGEHSFLWKGGNMRDLMPSDRQATPRYLSAHSTIAGGVPSGVFRWQKGHVDRLATPAGANGADANGINDEGLVIGNAQVGRDEGLVIGNAQVGRDYPALTEAVLWTGLKPTLLVPGSPDSYAMRINNAGTVVGGYKTPAGAVHAFTWKAGKLTDLGTPAGYLNSFATYINAEGIVAGQLSKQPVSNALDYRLEEPFVMAHGLMKDLNVLAAGSGWQLNTVVGVDARGQIFGNGTHGGHKRAFMLAPPGGFWG